MPDQQQNPWRLLAGLGLLDPGLQRIELPVVTGGQLGGFLFGPSKLPRRWRLSSTASNSALLENNSTRTPALRTCASTGGGPISSVPTKTSGRRLRIPSADNCR